jgi:geranylgeranyl pyrophosphate synthase
MAGADPDQTEVLKQVGDPDLTAEQVDDLVQVLHDTGAVDRNEAEIGRLVDESAAVLAELPLTDDAIEALSAMSIYVADRTV